MDGWVGGWVGGESVFDACPTYNFDFWRVSDGQRNVLTCVGWTKSLGAPRLHTRSPFHGEAHRRARVYDQQIKSVIPQTQTNR
jgi:hypothetical protein